MSDILVVVTKIMWLAVQPVSLVAILLVLGLLLGLMRRAKTARLALVLALLVLGVGAYTNAGYVALDVLETRFERPAPPLAVAGIIVLGGGMDADVNNVRGGYEFNRSGDRFLEALRLALLYPDARVLVTGGTSVLGNSEDAEADAGARFFLDFGIARERLILEDAARTTYENAELTRALIDPAAEGQWLLVTSAFHMPRSVGLFRKAGVPVVPWPADYLSTGRETLGLKPEQPAETLSIATLAMREWVGLLGYWMLGRIETPLPGP